MLYEFLYNDIGQRTSLSVGTSGNMSTLATYTYNSRNLTSRLTYGNGVYADYTYDDLDRLIKIRYNNRRRLLYTDFIALILAPCGATVKDGEYNNESDKIEYAYDNSSRVTRVSNSLSGYTSHILIFR